MVKISERSITITTVAVTDHVMTDLRNHRFHRRRTCHFPKSAACRRLPFFSGGLRCEAFDLKLRATDGGDRTHTHLRELDFESSASANSATSAFVRRQFLIRLP
jgi:hypothetical protein